MSIANGTVRVRFTKGFGNNLFQYCFARLLSEIHNMGLNHPAIPEMGIKSRKDPMESRYKTINIRRDRTGDKDYFKYFENKKEKCNYDVRGYFENYLLYKPYLSQIRSWFPLIPIANTKDVIIHIRLQNRLVQANSFQYFLNYEDYETALANFEFEKVHIVTDSEKWDNYTMEDIKQLRKNVKKGPNGRTPLVKSSESLKYIITLAEKFAKMNPVVHLSQGNVMKNSGGLRANFIDDFNLIRSFDKVVVHNSTFSWWAATLSGARRVGVWRPWKPLKSRNKNLGETDYPGWFSWGSYKNTHNINHGEIK